MEKSLLSSHAGIAVVFSSQWGRWQKRGERADKGECLVPEHLAVCTLCWRVGRIFWNTDHLNKRAENLLSARYWGANSPFPEGFTAGVVRLGDFPGGPVAKIPRSQCKVLGFNPWSGNQIPHAVTKTRHSRITKNIYFLKNPVFST